MSREEIQRWRVAPAGLRRGALVISFQRIAYRTELVRRAPSSLGALPVAAGPSDFILPLADGEGFWIGVEGASSAGGEGVSIRARCANGSERVVASHDSAAFAVIAGLVGPDGRYRVFARSWLERLCIRSGDETADLVPVSPHAFASSTGRERPLPFDKVQGYGGWKLP